MNAALEARDAANWDVCREITRSHSSSFYRASQVLGPRRRRAIHATYAFCRHADDLVDEAPTNDRAELLAALEDWEAQIERPTDPVAIAFAAARDEFGVPTQPAVELLRGIRMDLTIRRYQTWDDLREYCYLVAGTVGLLVAPILGCREHASLPHAVNLGIAMQLTNILRDVAEDAAGGRLYLPEEDLRRFDCEPEAILSQRRSGDFPGLIAFEIERARELFRDAALGIPSLSPSGRLATLSAMHFYAGILTAIERRQCDVLSGRAFVSSSEKLRLMPRILGSFMRMPFNSHGSYAPL